jgi:hypothetical protein
MRQDRELDYVWSKSEVQVGRRIPSTPSPEPAVPYLLLDSLAPTLSSIPGQFVTPELPERVSWHECPLPSGVEMWRGGLGAAYPLPALSSAGASLACGPADGRGKAERNPA